MPREFLQQFPRVTGKGHISWLATMKNDLSEEDATELALVRTLWRLLAASRATH